jgi:hypothetical protein
MESEMRKIAIPFLVFFLLMFSSCDWPWSGSEDQSPPTIQVNSIEDTWPPPEGIITLRAALSDIDSGGIITFAPDLDGGTIDLVEVDSDHSVLKGEVYLNGWDYQGYQERDYGRSALYVRKNVTIDASALPAGITLAWAGSDQTPARVLAVYGDLTMRNVTVTGGWSQSEPIDQPQEHTLARGAGLAVWGVATLEGCTIHGNRAFGDESGSRDRGAFGGGIYADRVVLRDCVISGNSVTGYGAAGGGVYSIGGSNGLGAGSSLTRCAVTGNRVTAQHAYGGGVYSDGGGRGQLMTITLTSCTLAQNAVADNPALDQDGQYYYRGGGFYMSNGRLVLAGCTIAENEVTGHTAEFNGKPNMGGGGVAATIGNAHVVEDMIVRHSIIVGNEVDGEAEDLFTGSLRHFYSDGYNLIGELDFRYILVPIPWWEDLSRKHWPKEGDQEKVDQFNALDDAVGHPSILSTGTDPGQAAVLYYPPGNLAENQIPADRYPIDYVKGEYDGEYEVLPEGTDDFLNQVLEQIRTIYETQLGADFGSSFPDMTGVTFYGPAVTWPSETENEEWITFWHDLDTEIDGRLGAVGLGDDFWDTFESGPVSDNVDLLIWTNARGNIGLVSPDQLGNARPFETLGDIGAVERY